MIFHTIRVLCNDKLAFGEPHAVIVDEDRSIDQQERQAIATRLGFDETVFINDIASGDVSFFDTAKAVPFAGTAALAAAWFINQQRDAPLEHITCGDKLVSTWQEHGQTWIATTFDTMPSWNVVQYDTVESVDRMTPGDAASLAHTLVWAWEDEQKGHIRARTFATDWDIPEVEANGSGSMMLAVLLGRPLRIQHGAGSLIMAEQQPSGMVAIGGSVVDDGTLKG